MQSQVAELHRSSDAPWASADCIAKFERDQGELTRCNLSVLKARAAVARDQLSPERLEEHMPQIAAIALGYMKGERLSNRERAGHSVSKIPGNGSRW